MTPGTEPRSATIVSEPTWTRDDGVTFERGEVVRVGPPPSVPEEAGWYSPRDRFNFLGHAVNTNTGEDWACLYGGDKDPNGTRGFRYVDPDRVQKVKR